jgi:hypothetical protein
MTIGFQLEDVERLRQHVRKMSDEKLTDFGLAAKFMCRDKRPLEVFVTQRGGEGIRKPSRVAEASSLLFANLRSGERRLQDRCRDTGCS